MYVSVVACSSWAPKANTKAEINSASISLNEIRSMGLSLLGDNCGRSLPRQIRGLAIHFSRLSNRASIYAGFHVGKHPDKRVARGRESGRSLVANIRIHKRVRVHLVGRARGTAETNPGPSHVRQRVSRNVGAYNRNIQEDA